MKVIEIENSINTVEPNDLPERPLLLCEHVRNAVKDYLARLDGEQVGNLHVMVLDEVERPLIETILEICGQNQSRAAQMLGLSRSTLRKKIIYFGLQ